MSCFSQSWNNMFRMLGSDGDVRLLKDHCRTQHSSALKDIFTAELHLVIPPDSWGFLLLCFLRLHKLYLGTFTAIFHSDRSLKSS